MDLMQHAIDEAFTRLTRLYGKAFTGMFEGEKLADVKAAWRQEVAGIPGSLDRIAWALHNLPERCPNAVQFRNLCRQAPIGQQQQAMLPDHAAVRGPTPEERQALLRLRDGFVFGQPSRQWAYDLIACHEAGWRNGAQWQATPAALRMAREAVATDPNRPRASTTDAPPQEPLRADPLQWDDYETEPF